MIINYVTKLRVFLFLLVLVVVVSACVPAVHLDAAARGAFPKRAPGRLIS